MKNANSASTARPLSTGGVDLVRLALALSGATRIDEVLSRAMDILSTGQPEMAWAILQRCSPGKYRTASAPGVSYEDLRRLSDRTCGQDNWLSLGSLLAQRSTLGQPVVCTIRGGESDGGPDPDVVLAQWTRLGAKLDPSDPDLENAARLIASSADAAAVFEYLLEQNCHDPLTGLLNRTGILDMMQREASRSRRSATDLSVLFLDLDGFKEVNDRHGHAVGDNVLRHIGGVLASGLRVSDAVGRIGGDEFLVVLPDTDLRTARRIGRRLAKVIETDSGRPMGLSYGAASLEEVDHTAAMVEKADHRMLSQKRRRQIALDPVRDRSKPGAIPTIKA